MVQLPPCVKVLGRWNVGSVVVMDPEKVPRGWNGQGVAVAVAVSVGVDVRVGVAVGTQVCVVIDRL